MMPLGYRPGLDGVRAFAIAIVVVSHLPEASWLPRTAGDVGVTVFFVLSGFLITRLLLEERARTGRINVPAFWRRRAARLLPAAVLLVAIVTLARPDFGRAAIALLYVSNWVAATGHSISPLDHYWSLAIEEQFYMVWPLLLPLLIRPRLLVVAAIAVTMWRTAQVDVLRGMYATDTRIDALLMGAAAAMVPAPRLGRWAATAGIAAGGLVVYADVVLGGNQVRTPLAILCAVVLVWVALDWKPPRAVIYVGVISYGIYLVHPPLFAWFGWWGVALTLPAAAVMYRFWESPLRRRLSGQRLAAKAGAPHASTYEVVAAPNPQGQVTA